MQFTFSWVPETNAELCLFTDKTCSQLKDTHQDACVAWGQRFAHFKEMNIWWVWQARKTKENQSHGSALDILCGGSRGWQRRGALRTDTAAATQAPRRSSRTHFRSRVCSSVWTTTPVQASGTGRGRRSSLAALEAPCRRTLRRDPLTASPLRSYCPPCAPSRQRAACWNTWAVTSRPLEMSGDLQGQEKKLWATTKKKKKKERKKSTIFCLLFKSSHFFNPEKKQRRKPVAC